MKYLVIRTGGTFPQYAQKHGDFQDWTARNMGIGADEWVCSDVKNGEKLPSSWDFSGCVITGSHDMVTDDSLPYLTSVKGWIRDAVSHDVPILGICFGHQLVADALGGKAGPHPQGPEIGTMQIHKTDQAANDPLFSTLPDTFPAHTTHFQSALALPDDAVILAHNEHEPHHAFRIGKHIWGVQFHPEFDAEAMRLYVAEQAQAILENGGDPSLLLSNVTQTHDAASLLCTFTAYCRSLSR